MSSIKRTEFELPAPSKNEDGAPAHFYLPAGYRPEITVRDGKAYVTVIEHNSLNVKDLRDAMCIIVADGEEFEEGRKPHEEAMWSVYFTTYIASYALNGTTYHLVTTKD
jgi:hypothetical protein